RGLGAILVAGPAHHRREYQRGRFGLRHARVLEPTPLPLRHPERHIRLSTITPRSCLHISGGADIRFDRHPSYKNVTRFRRSRAKKSFRVATRQSRLFRWVRKKENG